MNPIKVNNKKIGFFGWVEYVGRLRYTTWNSTTILARFKWGGGGYFLFYTIFICSVFKSCYIDIKQLSFWKNWTKRSGTPLFSPLKFVRPRGEVIIFLLLSLYFYFILYYLCRLYGIQNDRTDQTKTMQKEKRKNMHMEPSYNWMVWSNVDGFWSISRPH